MNLKERQTPSLPWRIKPRILTFSNSAAVVIQVICNEHGRVLLYFQRERALMGSLLHEAPSVLDLFNSCPS